MRVRSIVAIGVLLVPSVADAQFRLPGIGGRARGGLPEAAQLPRQPQIVARALAYNRMRTSFESYPLLGFYDAGNFAVNGSSGWVAAGYGQRIDYRVARYLSLTMDLASTAIGGPVAASSGELGFRVGPRRSESSVYPFFDLRSGYYLTSGGQFYPMDEFGLAPTQQNMSGMRYSEGFGGLVGGGLEFTLTRRLSLTTSMAVQRSSMTAAMTSPSVSIGQHYTLTSYRYVLALRFNGVRYVSSGNTVTQH